MSGKVDKYLDAIVIYALRRFQGRKLANIGEGIELRLKARRCVVVLRRV